MQGWQESFRKTGGNGVLAFSTQTGEEYVVRLVGTETLVKEVYSGKPNMKVKQLGKEDWERLVAGMIFNVEVKNESLQ